MHPAPAARCFQVMDFKGKVSLKAPENVYVLAETVETPKEAGMAPTGEQTHQYIYIHTPLRTAGNHAPHRQ